MNLILYIFNPKSTCYNALVLSTNANEAVFDPAYISTGIKESAIEWLTLKEEPELSLVH